MRELSVRHMSLPDGCSARRRWVIVLTMFMLAILFPPRLFQEMGIDEITLLVRCMKVVGFFVALVLYVKRVGIDVFGVLLFGYGISLCISSIVNGGSPHALISGRLPPVSIALFVRSMAPAYLREVLQGALYFGSILSVANLIILIFVPAGTPLWHSTSSETALCGRNSFCLYYFFAVFSSICLDCLGGVRVSARTAVCYLMACAQTLIAYSATSFMMLVFAFLAFLLAQWKKARRFCDIGIYSAVYIVVFLGVVVLELPQKIWGSSIPLLNRSATFSGRLEIWEKTISLVGNKHCVFGYYNGQTTPLVFEGSPNSISFWTAHNAILDVVLWGGLVLLAIVLALYIIAAMPAYRHRESVSGALLSMIIGVFLVHGITEAIVSVTFFFWLAIAYCWYPESTNGEMATVPKSQALNGSVDDLLAS